MTDARTVLALIRDLDIGVHAGSAHDEAGISYLQITRWNGPDGSGGCTDDAATLLVRALLREKLGSFHISDIGAAALAEVDKGLPE